MDNTQREPQAAAVTFAFFAIGQLFQWLTEPDTLQVMKDVLSILSFMISIMVGITTMIKLTRKRKD